MNFRRAKLIECDIWAGYPSENMILRKETPRRIMLRKGSPREQMWDVRGIFSGGDSPKNHVTQRVSPGTNVRHSWNILRGDSPENHVTQRVLYITGTYVRKFVEPDIDSPQNHAPRNLITQLSLYRGNMRGNIYIQSETSGHETRDNRIQEKNSI